MSHHWFDPPIAAPDAAVRAVARERQAQLTKPPGSLGRLEDLGMTLAAMQDTQHPRIDKLWITVFAGDHGVVAEGVSAFPQVVTAEMVRNFARGGAAISVLAKVWNARLEVVNVGTVQPLEDLPGVLDARVGPGTANFVHEPAMTVEQLHEALATGHDAAERAAINGAQVFIGGEMGIGNTTSATGVICSLLGLPAAQLAGPGTGLDAAGVIHKGLVIERALARHRDPSPLIALQRLGGFEIAALTGAYLRCGQLGLPALVDGFITTAAALAAVRLRPELAAWLFYAHCSAEPGHRQVLEALGAKPLLDLGMRLGEGSGAAVAVPILRAAAALHAGMATFAEAGVSTA
ncbi:MAG: nicotinate-nucleotide--dimethylbenzimidazole phosphoribosyltransferase [Candidatus Competibacteraceae bacterium]|nr:nicotinate-nucleotide--dimethylbenzimidazole phosphoribosyltransferase [Candidatus Competibacteraceae bacterium]MBK8753872.1 nicotinate-nucleotide--dimethylbenzimidazole phosphoribosyltransferase [Candidatus Competibacteraceae bacterium]